MSELAHPVVPGRWTAAYIDKVLWEVAAAGGNCRMAHEHLVRAATEAYEESGTLTEVPSERTVRDWVSRRFRNRYHEVQAMKVAEMDEVIAQDGQRLAIQLAEAEERALKQTLAGLGQANAVEASQILRNLSQSKKSQVDNAVVLRRQATASVDARTVTDLAAALVRAGAAVLAEPAVVEAEVVED